MIKKFEVLKILKTSSRITIKQVLIIIIESVFNTYNTLAKLLKRLEKLIIIIINYILNNVFESDSTKYFYHF